MVTYFSVCWFLPDAGRQTCAAGAGVWSGSHLPSVLPWPRLVKASVSLPRGPRGFATPAPSHNTWDGGSAMPCRGFCRASPLSSSAQTSGPFLSILWFSSSLVSCLDCSSPWAVCPRVPVLSLRLFSPRKALQLWVSVWAAAAVSDGGLPEGIRRLPATPLLLLGLHIPLNLPPQGPAGPASRGSSGHVSLGRLLSPPGTIQLSSSSVSGLEPALQSLSSGGPLPVHPSLVIIPMRRRPAHFVFMFASI